LAQFSKAIALFAALVACGAQATPLSELPPYAIVAFGQQSDSGVSPYVQSTGTIGNASVNAVAWWGYHGVNSTGPANDDFRVQLNGTILQGALNTDASNPQIPYYTLLLLQSFVGVPATLSVSNEGVDVEWYWQSAATAGGAHATNVAYRLEGSVQAVPEPSILSMLLLSMALLGTARLAGSRRPDMTSAIQLTRKQH